MNYTTVSAVKLLNNLQFEKDRLNTNTNLTDSFFLSYESIEIYFTKKNDFCERCF